MYSWQIFRTLFNVRDAAEGPLYYFDRARPPIWWSVADHLLSDSPRLLLLLTGTGCYLCVILTRHIGPLVMMITLLPFLGAMIVSINVAPVVAQERERHTWDLLRVAPLSIETLLLSRAAGRLWWMRDSLRVLFSLLVIIALFLSCASTLLIPPPRGSNLICWGSLAIALLSVVLILADRVQQFVLIVVTALAAGSSCSSARAALTASTSAVFAIWTADLIIAALVISQAKLDPNLLVEQVLLASFLGPAASYITTIPSGQGLVYAAVTIIIREVLVYLLWRYTVHIAAMT